MSHCCAKPTNGTGHPQGVSRLTKNRTFSNFPKLCKLLRRFSVVTHRFLETMRSWLHATPLMAWVGSNCHVPATAVLVPLVLTATVDMGPAVVEGDRDFIHSHCRLGDRTTGFAGDRRITRKAVLGTWATSLSPPLNNRSNSFTQKHEKVAGGFD